MCFQCSKMDCICSRVLLFMVLCSQSSAGESQLIGSPHPIVAVEGDDVILPCSLEPPIDAENLTVAWTGPDLELKYVHFYRNGHNLQEKINQRYKDRTMLFEGELVRGNVSLKLSRVKLKDEGNYTCLVKDGQKKETVIQLRVVVVSKPVVSIMGVNGTGVVLQCESGSWYPEPKLEWRHSEGRLLPADVTQTDRHPDPGRHQRYTVTSRVTVQKTDNFTCRVHLQGLNQTMEKEIHVSDDLFPLKNVEINDQVFGIIVGVVGVVGVLVLAAAAAAAVWKKCGAYPKVSRPSDPEAESQNQDTIIHVDFLQPNQDTSLPRSSSSQSVQCPLLPAKDPHPSSSGSMFSQDSQTNHQVS